jgi:hypothetical protein
MPPLWRKVALAGVATATLAVALESTTFAAHGTTYQDSAYAHSDIDNITRSLERQTSELTTPTWDAALIASGGDSWLESQARQVGDLPELRLHATLGSVLPGGAVGQPLDYGAGTWQPVEFVARTGAKLYGRIWNDPSIPGPKPGVVITTGSLQGTQEMYWWFARTLAAHGYEVLTWDVQGQGQSEVTGHIFGEGNPTIQGVPFQQAANFVEGTIDALRFFLSTSSHPYRPLPATTADVAAEQAQAKADGAHLDWVNPGAAGLDATRIGIVGHSLGADAVSEVQQCSDQGTLWKTLPLCQGTPFPIRAVIAWDALSSGVTPVVPALDEEADGYFLNPEPSPTAPDPRAHLDAYNRWHKAGLPAMTFTIRGGVHTEWAVYPLISLGTAYGTALADHYSLAWFDRYVKGDPAAASRLAITKTTAHFLSVRFLSAHDGLTDLRKAAGQSAVGDWAGANADPVGSYNPLQQAGHGDGATGLNG